MYSSSTHPGRASKSDTALCEVCNFELPLILVSNDLFPGRCGTLHCEESCLITVDLDSGTYHAAGLH